MISITIDTSGLTELEQMLKDASKQVISDLDAIVRAAGETSLAVAKRESPVDQGILRNANNLQKVEPMSYKLSNNSPHAPFLEFGTGKKVDIPEDFSELAIQFKGGNGGSFEEGLQAVKDWCNRKGIPEEASYPIFISILNNGITAKPFLWPAYKEGRKQLIQDVTDYVNNFRINE